MLCLINISIQGTNESNSNTELVHARNEFIHYCSVKNMFLRFYTFMAHSHCTGPGNDGSLYYAMYCTHHTGTGTGYNCYLLRLSWTLSLSWSQPCAVCISHYCHNAKELHLLFSHWYVPFIEVSSESCTSGLVAGSHNSEEQA